MPVPVSGFLKVQHLTPSTGVFTGEIENIGGVTTASVSILPDVQVTLRMHGGVSGTFRWNQGSVVVYPTNLTVSLELDSFTYEIPVEALAIPGTYANNEISVQAFYSYADTYMGRSFSVSFSMTLKGVLEELPGEPTAPIITTDGFGGTWYGSWTSTLFPGEQGGVRFNVCQKESDLLGEALLYDTECGDVVVPVYGTVNGNVMMVSSQHECQGVRAYTDFTQGVLVDENTIAGVFKLWIDGHELYDEGAFQLERTAPITIWTDGVWKDKGGSWFAQKYDHGGALLIYSADLSSFQVYGIDSASSMTWTSGPDLVAGGYSAEFSVSSYNAAVVTVTELSTQIHTMETLVKFAGVRPAEDYGETDGVWKDAQGGNWFFQRYGHCGALVIYTEDMSSYRVYGVDSGAGLVWTSGPDMNSGAFSVVVRFFSSTECSVTIQNLTQGTSETRSLTKFAGAL